MKPRTKYQKQVVASYAKLQPILPKRVMAWAKKNVVKHFAYRLPSGRTTCLECGHTWRVENENTGVCHCPHCGTSLEVRNTRERTHKEYSYFSYITTFQHLQVVRTFRLGVKYYKTIRPEYDCFEVCLYWINPQGNVEVVGLKRTMGYYIDSFSYDSPIELRHDSDVFRRVSDCFICPYMHTIPEIKRNGFFNQFGDIAPVSLFEAILKDSRIETLMKHRDIDAVSHFMHDTKSLNDYWQSYKIAQRNHYHIEDYSLWSDLLRLLEQNGKDIRNAHYICPTDLKATHDYWLQKKREREERERREREQKTALAEQANFEKMKSKFFGIVFKDDLLTITVLDSVQAHFDEGNAMHHCVAAMEYFKKPQSLIMSARIDGKRIETVELSLKTMKVVQSRGVCNKNTDYHDRIVNLVNSNAKTAIAQAKRKWRKAV